VPLVDRVVKRGGAWVPGFVAGLVAGAFSGALALYVHDHYGNKTFERVLEIQEKRLADLEDGQKMLVGLHRHDQRLDEWRDAALQAMAKSLEVDLPSRPVPTPRLPE
jgi:hypothetical protein